MFLLVLFPCRDPSPLYESSIERTTLKSVTSYQAEIKYLEEA